MAMFAPLAIAVHVTGMSNNATALACETYFRARRIYAPLYKFKVPVLRAAVWFVGLSATLVLAYELLK